MKKYLLFLLFASNAMATVNTDLSAYFDKNIDAAQSSMCSKPTPTTDTDQWIVDENLDVISHVSFGIDCVLNLTISPEIDFVMTPVKN
jgi:hypothetical protein